MFRYKKYGLRAGAVNKNRGTGKATRVPEPASLGVRVSAQVPQPLAQRIDLIGGAILRRTFPILGEFCASQGRVALRGELGDLPRRIERIDGRRRARRGLQQPIHALRACPNPEAGPQLLADRDAARRALRLPQFLDDREDCIVRNLLRSSHWTRLR